MKNYLEQQISENDKRGKSHQSLDPVSAEYWKGRADAYRDVLKRLESEAKPDRKQTRKQRKKWADKK